MTDTEFLNNFEKLYEHFFDKIYGFVFRRVGEKETVQDIVSDIFLKVYRNLESFEEREKGSLSSWIYTIAQNEIFQYYRRNEKTKTVQIPEGLEIPSGIDVEDETNDKQVSDMTKELLQKLPEEERNIILMKYFDELKNTEIADILEIKANNVGVRLHRALKKFKDILESHNITV